MDVSKQRQDRHADARRRAAVLEVTVAVLEEVGYQRLRSETVAARAGVGPMLLRRWWASRALLVAEALQHRDPPAEVLPTGDLRDDVRGMVMRTASFLADPVVADALTGLMSDAVRDPVAADRLAALLAPRRATDTSVLLSAVGRGDLPRDVDVSLLLDVVFGTLLFRRVRDTGSGDDILDALVEHVVSAGPAHRAELPPPRHGNSAGIDRDAVDTQAGGQMVNGYAVDGQTFDGNLFENAEKW